MKVAVMQPYFMPYIGYFQMIKAVDKFVFYDDVNFIKQGWINRNRILLQHTDFLFTVPLQKATSFSLIKDTFINQKFYASWKEKFLQSIAQNYKKAPHFEVTYSLISAVLNKNFQSISELAIESVKMVSGYLNLNTEFYVASERYQNKELEREKRLISICKNENATDYINAVGGKELYSKEIFKENGVELQFIASKPIVYKQFKDDFIPWLSIIDVLMFNSVAEVNELLNEYELT